MWPPYRYYILYRAQRFNFTSGLYIIPQQHFIIIWNLIKCDIKDKTIL